MSSTESLHIPDEQIRDGILDTLAEDRDQMIPLRVLRAEWEGYGDVTRDRLDAVLKDLVSGHTVKIIPEANQKTLTDEDRAAALWLGGEYRHLITFK